MKLVENVITQYIVDKHVYLSFGVLVYESTIQLLISCVIKSREIQGDTT